MIKTRSLLLLLVASMTAFGQQKVHYTLGMPRPSTHLLEVEAEFSGLPANDRSLDLQLPVWRPGRYLVLDFASGVQEFSAVTDGQVSLRWSKIEKSVWRIETNG